MSGASGNEVTIAAALIGVAGSIGAALITVRAKPREAPVSQPAQPQQVGVQADGTYRYVQSPDARGASVAAGSRPGAIRGRLKISASLWWGIAACVCFAVFALSWGCALVGVFLAVRDIRSPGTRRLPWWGLALCALGLIIAAANPHSGFMTGFHQGYDQSSH
jgi:hypothetical protein